MKEPSQMILQPSMTNTDKTTNHYQQLFINIIAYFKDLLNHLLQANSQSNFNLLIVCYPHTTQHLKPAIMQLLEADTMCKHSVNCEFIASDEFLAMDFTTRYDLGCFIDTLIHETHSPNKLVNTDDAIANIDFISTRLRDLFAEQCVIILDKTYSEQVNLRSLGYIQIDTKVAQNIIIWQFNLYDYKPQPDWLNAKYWANPENFDKYRW